jgi:hypothetical protein
MDEAITEVSICNSALIKLGQKVLIGSLDEDTVPARLCNARFSYLRNKVLEDHNWGFATKMVELASVDAGSTELDGWGYAYEKPADFLRMQRGEDWDEEFDTVNEYLLADVEPFKIKYTAKITDTGRYTYAFAEVLAWRIAAELAYALVNSKEVAALMMQGYEMDLKAARYNDSHKKSPEGPFANTWVDARN